MIKKYASLALICLLLVTANFSIISAQTDTDKNAESIAKIKKAVAERGTGEKNRVEVKMLDGTTLKGYVSNADDDSFTLVDSKTKQSTVIAYSDVAKVKKRSKGGNLGLGLAIGAGVGAVVLGGFLIARCRNEGGC